PSTVSDRGRPATRLDLPEIATFRLKSGVHPGEFLLRWCLAHEELRVGRSIGKKRFCLALVKPSHYDDDGYVIHCLRSPIPSTSLGALYGLAQDCAERRVLGPDVEIDVHAFDETNARIRCDRLAAMIEVAGAGMVMLVGVQSNQFPRALDLAKALRERDIPVAIGGFHVSGTISILD